MRFFGIDFPAVKACLAKATCCCLIGVAVLHVGNHTRDGECRLRAVEDMPVAEKHKVKMPPGRYQVWHDGRDGFVPVANVQADNLLAALVLTINRTDAPWAENKHVAALMPSARSTDIGDVIVNPEGAAYRVQNTRHGLVFERIDFPPHREQKALFAEWKLDYAAARSRDSKVPFGQNLSGSPEPSQAVKDKQKGHDGGRER